MDEGAKRLCGGCGTPLVEETGFCPSCRGYRLTGGTGMYSVTGHSIGTAVESPLDAPGGRHVDYRPTSGGRSFSQTDSEGAFTTELTEPLERGRQGENRVLKVFMQALRDRGNDVSLLPGASDRHGEDGLLLLNGREITVQIVTMPAEAGRWSELRVQASANQAGTGLEAVQMVRQAIEKKASARGNLLALDAAHYGALVSPGLVEAYVSEYGDPALEFSFIQVWMIGPTARSSTCLARV